MGRKEKKRIFKPIWLLPLLSIGIISVSSVSAVACSESVQTTTDSNTNTGTKYSPNLGECVVVTLNNNSTVYGIVSQPLTNNFISINGKSYYYENIQIQPFPFKVGQNVVVTCNPYGEYYGSISQTNNFSSLVLKNNKTIPWVNIAKISLSTEPVQTQFNIGDYVSIQTKSGSTYCGFISKVDVTNSELTLSLNGFTCVVASSDISNIKLAEQLPFKNGSFVQVQTTPDLIIRNGRISSKTNPEQLVLTNVYDSNWTNLNGDYAINWGSIGKISPLLDQFSIGTYVIVTDYSGSIYYGRIDAKDANTITLAQNKTKTININDIKDIRAAKEFPYTINNFIQVTPKSGSIKWGNISNITPSYLEITIDSSTLNVHKFAWSDINDIISIPDFKLGTWISFVTNDGKTYYGSLFQYNTTNITLIFNDYNHYKIVPVSEIDLNTIKLEPQSPFKIGDTVEVKTKSEVYRGGISDIGTSPEKLQLYTVSSFINIPWGDITSIVKI
ncbi:hypothetical protein [Mycoplasmoides alvi]|uniref:hypothetical protein n=1 Tax=Mycoplasmoides alvi TaxID=78580 RepID=UPI00051AFCB2|nr:hypothetical protein [Mycoplasmoides alvi]